MGAAGVRPDSMIRFLFVRIIFPLLVFWLVRSALKSLFASFQSGGVPQNRPQQPPPVSVGGELKKDPVCGTYVSTAASITRSVNGELLHFCSKECRDKYRVA
ncbi:TRASH domain protein [Candidatus Sulfopaludibacter sp. SbA4]|nr:TRASH domain protein [Candidatus Sulfopaludibacter sp. SbA4]